MRKQASDFNNNYPKTNLSISLFKLFPVNTRGKISVLCVIYFGDNNEQDRTLCSYFIFKRSTEKEENRKKL